MEKYIFSFFLLLADIIENNNIATILVYVEH